MCTRMPPIIPFFGVFNTILIQTRARCYEVPAQPCAEGIAAVFAAFRLSAQLICGTLRGTTNFSVPAGTRDAYRCLFYPSMFSVLRLFYLFIFFCFTVRFCCSNCHRDSLSKMGQSPEGKKEKDTGTNCERPVPGRK